MLTLLFVVFTTITVRGAKQEVYMENADDLFETILGGVYKVKHRYSIPNITEIEVNQTTIPTLDEELDLKFPNLSVKGYVMNLIDKKIEELVPSNRTVIPDFGKDVDEIELTTRRFNNIVRKRSTSFETRRDNSQKDFPIRKISQLYRSYALMEQFIYLTRNRLPYAQLLRKKYKHTLRYKVGYCLALLRSLKQDQIVIYSNYKKRYREFPNSLLHLTLYEKVLRLDIDIKDVIKLIKHFDKERAAEEDENDEITTLAGDKDLTNAEGFPHPAIPGAPRARSKFEFEMPKVVKSGVQWRRMDSKTKKPGMSYQSVTFNRPFKKPRLWSANSKINKNINFLKEKVITIVN